MSARLTPFVAVMGLILPLTGCDGSSEHSRSIADLEKRVEAMEKRLQQLEGQLAAGTGAATAAETTAATATTATEPAGTGPVGAATPQDDRGSQPIAPATPGIEVVANPELKGSMGRIVVEFPKETKADDTLVKVNKAGEKTAGTSDYGGLKKELLPGTYELTIAGARVGGAQVKAKHDTRIPVGVLRISTSDPGTSVAVFSADGSQQLNSGYGSRDVGLPAGKYTVKVAGQSAPVEIKAGEVTEF